MGLLRKIGGTIQYHNSTKNKNLKKQYSKTELLEKFNELDNTLKKLDKKSK